MNTNIFNLIGLLLLLGSVGCGLFIEFWFLEEPCFLCFLQRASMLMIAVGLYWNLIYGVTIRHYAFSLLAALLGLSCSLRHMALNVCKPLSDTTFFFFSYRIYTWSFLVFFLSLISLSVLLFFYKITPPVSVRMQNIMRALFLAEVTLCLVSILYHKGLAF